MNKLFETKKAYDQNVKAIKEQITSLFNVIESMPEQESVLLPIVQEKQVLLEEVAKMKSWNFNFESGGWNSISARTKEEAIENAQNEYDETEKDQRYHCKENGGSAIPLTRVNVKTFRVATPADTAALCSMFY